MLGCLDLTSFALQALILRGCVRGARLLSGSDLSECDIRYKDSERAQPRTFGSENERALLTEMEVI